MSDSNSLTRRDFIGGTVAALAAAQGVMGAEPQKAAAPQPEAQRLRKCPTAC